MNITPKEIAEYHGLYRSFLLIESNKMRNIIKPISTEKAIKSLYDKISHTADNINIGRKKEILREVFFLLLKVQLLSNQSQNNRLSEAFFEGYLEQENQSERIISYKVYNGSNNFSELFKYVGRLIGAQMEFPELYP